MREQINPTRSATFLHTRLSLWKSGGSHAQVRVQSRFARATNSAHAGLAYFTHSYRNVLYTSLNLKNATLTRFLSFRCPYVKYSRTLSYFFATRSSQGAGERQLRTPIRTQN